LLDNELQDGPPSKRAFFFAHPWKNPWSQVTNGIKQD